MNEQNLIPPEAMEIDQPYDPWMEAAVELEQMAQVLDLEPWIIEVLRRCESELNCNLLLRRDDGAAQTCRAIRVGFSSLLGPQCGQLHISGNAYLNRIRAAAVRNTWSAALFGLPVAGCATALLCDPQELSEHELQCLVEEFAHSNAAPKPSEILLPGDGANDYVFGWLTRAEHSGIRLPVAECARNLAPIGIAHAINQMMKPSHEALPVRFALQGFGPAERNLADELVRRGATLVAVVDGSGGVVDPQGLKLSTLQAHVNSQQLLLEYPDADSLCNSELLEISTDVLVLSSGERQVTGLNAGRIKATLVVECVPDAVTPRGEEILADRGITVLPFAFINGLRLAAGVQQCSSNSGNGASARRALATLRLAAGHTLRQLIFTACTKKLSLRATAQRLALERVAHLLRLQGRGL